ncbi:MAG: lipoprotein signal peptidase [Bacteroidota bacterium]
MRFFRYFLLALLILALDQTTKLLVYENMYRGEEIPLLGDWLKIHYTLNPGVAFGASFSTPLGKLGLTLFRATAVIVIAVYIIRHEVKKFPTSYLFAVSMIFAGALGNVVDSTFYGIFLEGNAVIYLSHPQESIPFYPWFQGQVIDMIYFDIARGHYPDWLPLLGGKSYSFWPIFNVADASIFLGVTYILINYKKFFPKENPRETASIPVGE